MHEWILASAVLALGCKKDPKQCAALLDKTEARITDELRQAAASTMVTDHLETEKREAPHAASAGYPFEPGLAIHIDPTDGALAREAVERTIQSEACVHKGTPLRIYLLALPTTPASLLAARVGWLEAAATTWNKPLEILMPVKLPAEVRYWDWPDGTSSEVKAFGKEILDAPQRNERITRLQEKIRSASDGCGAIAKRTEAAADGPRDAIHYAMAKGLRDCGCNGVDAHDVIGLYHIFDITSSDVGWVRLSVTRGTLLPAGATVGDLLAGAKADAKSVLRVPDATLQPVEPLACESLPPIVQLRITEEWEKPPVEASGLIHDITEQLAGCVKSKPLERSAIADLFVQFGGSLLAPGEGETSLSVHDRTQNTYDLESCMKSSLQMEHQEVGFAHIEIYIPGKSDRQGGEQL
ncbi:MAG TPA: hypothetical protein VFQ65_03315 [Kofleriaceae bacterium]|nr:hypothetical protein [Kofleriaceae bacterium]